MQKKAVKQGRSAENPAAGTVRQIRRKIMEDDTVRLLRECNAGVKMGISSLDDVMDHVREGKLRELLRHSRQTHERLGDRAHEYLAKCHDSGKEPAAMAKVMSWVKTNVKLAGEESDRTAADLLTDGCNMGIKSLYRYLHQYPAADKEAKKLTEDIIGAEEALVTELRAYL